MAKEIDAGPIYLKRDLSLLGTAQKIYNDAAIIIADMIKEIIETTGATSMKDMGRVMKAVKGKIADSGSDFDGGKLSGLVKEKLG